MVKRNLAIYGAGYAGLHIFEELVQSKDINIICFVDDNQDLRSKKIGNTEILNPNEFDSKVINFDIDELIISIPSASSESIKRNPLETEEETNGDWAATGIMLGSVSNLHWAKAPVPGSIATVPVPTQDEVDDIGVWLT